MWYRVVVVLWQKSVWSQALSSKVAGEYSRRRASDIALPGSDFWLFDDRLVQFNHFSGDGDWIDVETNTDPAVIKLCADAFEVVWARAVPHQSYRPA
jgi:hypothetical protein